jgi:hypothetical protein
MAARLALLLLAVPCLALGVHGLHADHSCHTQLRAARQLPPRDRYAAAQAEHRIAQWCTHDTDKASGIIALGAGGHLKEARALARTLVADAPGDYLGWLALSRLDGDPAAAKRDYARARALNARGLRGQAP